MASIDEELRAAKAAKAAIDVLLTTPTPKSAVAATIRTANTAAVVNLGRGGALNDARVNVGIALSTLIDRPPTPERINNAKAAIEAWIKELEAAQA
jgi:hypothetical protein